MLSTPKEVIRREGITPLTQLPCLGISSGMVVMFHKRVNKMQPHLIQGIVVFQPNNESPFTLGYSEIWNADGFYLYEDEIILRNS